MADAASLSVEYLPIDTLTPDEGNAKNHAEEDVEAIKKSIEQFKFSDPIGIWGPDNLIVEGHGRVLAARELGTETVPCIRLDHLTDAERRAYALAHNKTAELSGWNFPELEREIAELTDFFDMSDFGFDTDENQEGDLDGLFEDAPQKEKEPKQIKCPHCGLYFTP